MGMKPTVPDDGSIQHQIGTAYDTVKSVADNLEDLLELKNQFDVFGSTYVPNTRTINGKPLSADINLNAGDVGARVSSWVPTWLDITNKPTTLAGYGITDAQKLDATLTALSNTVTAANKLIYFTAEDTTATTDISSFGRTLIDDADASAARTTLGLGSAATFASTAFQAASATLSTFNANIASVNVGVFKKTAANVWDFVALTDADIPNLNVSKLTAGTLPVVRGGTGRSDNKSAALITPVTITIGSTGKSFDGSASVAWTLAELGAQAVNANLTSFSALSGVADRVPYFTGPNTVALTNYTAFARTMDAAIDAAAVNTLLGVRTKAELDTIADFFNRATLDYDFVNGVYKEYSNRYINQLPLLDAVTCARNSTATADHPFGVVTYDINEPRVQYNALTGARLGLLCEEQRTNLCLWSEDFTNAAWTKNAVTVSGNATTAPDGLLSADKVLAGAISSTHWLRQIVSSSASTMYTLSTYLKEAEYSKGRLRFGTNIGFVSEAIFDLSTGTVSGAGAAIESVGNGFFRVSVSASTQVAATQIQFDVYIRDSSGNETFTGNGTSGLFVWGAQVEAGTAATSYIPTTTAAMQRIADVVSKGLNQYNISAGSIFIDFDLTSYDKAASGAAIIVKLSDAADTSSRGFGLQILNNVLAVRIRDAVYSYNTGISVADSALPMKALISFDNSTLKLMIAVNGVASETTMPTRVDISLFLSTLRLHSASTVVGTTEQHSKTVKRCTYVPRATSAAEAAVITK